MKKQNYQYQFFSSVQIAKDIPEDKKGWKWDVVVIKAGKTLTNPPYYVPTNALHNSLKVFEGSKVYANSIADANGHKRNKNEKVPGDIVAVLSKPYVENDELHATMNIMPSAQWLKENLIALSDEGLLGTVYQLSIDSIVDAKREFVASINETLPVVNRIIKADVDIVGEAAAGGRINTLAASQTNNLNEGDTIMRQKLLSILFFFPTLLAGKTVENWNEVPENDLYTHLLQAGKGFLPDSLPAGLTDQSCDELVASYRENAEKIKTAKFENGILKLQAANTNIADQGKNAQSISDLQAAIAKQNAELESQKKLTDTLLKEQCATLLASRVEKLPVPLKESLNKRFAGKTFTVAELESAIAEGKDLIAPFMASSPNNYGFDIKAGADSYDKLQATADLFFLTSNQSLNPLRAGTDEYKQIAQGMSPIRSFKELYVAITGDVNVTGVQTRSQRLTASLESSDWTNIISTAMNKRLVRDYLALNLDSWRAWATIRDGVTNFKQQESVRFGGYANLPVVAEGAPYLGATSPTDEKATWTPTKKGYTEDLTREMTLNDDVSAIQRITVRMARAAGQTLHEFVYDLINPAVNATIYDGVALYHATHLNIGAAALDSNSLAAGRLRMKKQTMKDNNKRLGIRAGYLIVPSDLQKTAYDLLTPAYNKANQVPEFLQQIGVTPIIVDYWTDATDWVLVARREDTETVEIGFVNGQETPETFISDLPNVGSFFTHDKITFKIRHEYGGAVVDYRGFDGSIVA